MLLLVIVSRMAKTFCVGLFVFAACATAAGDTLFFGLNLTESNLFWKTRSRIFADSPGCKCIVALLKSEVVTSGVVNAAMSASVKSGVAEMSLSRGLVMFAITTFWTWLITLHPWMTGVT